MSPSVGFHDVCLPELTYCLQWYTVQLPLHLWRMGVLLLLNPTWPTWPGWGNDWSQGTRRLMWFNPLLSILSYSFSRYLIKSVGADEPQVGESCHITFTFSSSRLDCSAMHKLNCCWWIWIIHNLALHTQLPVCRRMSYHQEWKEEMIMWITEDRFDYPEMLVSLLKAVLLFESQTESGLIDWLHKYDRLWNMLHSFWLTEQAHVNFSVLLCNGEPILYKSVKLFRGKSFLLKKHLLRDKYELCAISLHIIIRSFRNVIWMTEFWSWGKEEVHY